MLKQTLDSHGITRYALAKKTGLAMGTVRSMYEGTPTRVDFPVITKIVDALSEISGTQMSANDVFVWEQE